MMNETYIAWQIFCLIVGLPIFFTSIFFMYKGNKTGKVTRFITAMFFSTTIISMFFLAASILGAINTHLYLKEGEETLYTNSLLYRVKNGDKIYVHTDYYKKIMNDQDSHQYDKISVTTKEKSISFLEFIKNTYTFGKPNKEQLLNIDIKLLQENGRIQLKGTLSGEEIDGEYYYLIGDYKLLDKANRLLDPVLGKELNLDIVYQVDTSKDNVIKDYKIISSKQQ